MKIVRLRAENIKRLSAVEITPDGTLVTVGGKNGAGKSSVLDAIAYALGGQKLIPSQPIRKGETEARIDVDLGDFVVTRKFSRERLIVHDVPTWGELKSSLAIRNKDGASFPSPQAMLDKLLGQLTFDPLAFARAKPHEQQESLRKLVNLDFTDIHAQRRGAYERRAALNKDLAAQEVLLGTMSFHLGLPADEVSMDDVSVAMMNAENMRRHVQDLQQHSDGIFLELETIARQLARKETIIAELKARLANEENDFILLDQQHKDLSERLAAQKSKVSEAFKAIPDVSVLQAKVADVTALNTKVRHNQRYAELQRTIADLTVKANAETTLIANLDVQKEEMLAAAAFPVPGLSVTDDAVTFNGMPLEQASSSEQLRISVAIGLALNPKLKVLLIRNGNMLDADSLKILSDMATAADSQCWLEWVTANGGEVAVMIEDGHLAVAQAGV